MVANQASKAAAIRARLGHPIVDCDGHADPIGPDFQDFVREVGGVRMAERFAAAAADDPAMDMSMYGRWNRASLAERRDAAIPRAAWWFFPTANTLDRATAKLPRLMHERLDELGIDFSILYLSPLALDFRDDELRRVACRATNRYYAEIYRPYADRLTPAAIIPMYTPAEAIEELEYAVRELGLKAAQIAGYVRRPIPKLRREFPDLDLRYAYRIDTFGIDSEYDYDPVWAKCVELGVAPTSHSVAMGWTARRSPSTYMYNHIGHFGEAGEALFKSLFFGGVTRRFPTLRLAMLECGVGWACNLYASLIARWRKRNGRAMLDNLDPARLDHAGLLAYVERYGDEAARARLPEIARLLQLSAAEPRPDEVDEFAAAGIERAEDIRDRFIPNFFFGCEADDPLNAWAFDTKVNPFGARLNAMFSSDISHWDVPDMSEVVPEAYELVDHGLLAPEEFRDFAFTHAVKLHAGMNPRFFEGTRVAADAAKALAAIGEGRAARG